MAAKTGGGYIGNKSIIGDTPFYTKCHREAMHSICGIIPETVYAWLWRSTAVGKTLPIPDNKQR